MGMGVDKKHLQIETNKTILMIGVSGHDSAL